MNKMKINWTIASPAVVVSDTIIYTHYLSSLLHTLLHTTYFFFANTSIVEGCLFGLLFMPTSRRGFKALQMMHFSAHGSYICLFTVKSG